MKNLLVIAFTLVSLVMTAQNGVLNGRIVDESSLPLAGAYVVIADLAATTSDVDGYYSIVDLPAGSYKLEISYIGFEPQEITVEVAAGKTTVQNIKLEAGIALQEVVVTSQLRGQARALNNQLSNYNITNIIAADQIGRFPDANVGDALKRIPGISVQYDQGEARFGSIRGTAPQLNAVTINGERIPSAEAEIRTIQLDLIPSDMVQSIEVSKAVTPDMDADAIGGSVNLVTRAAPYQERISGTLGVGYNALAEEMTYNGSFIYGNRFANDKLGIIVSGSYFDNNLGSDNVEAEWTFDDSNDNDRFDEGEEFWPEEIQIRQYYLQRIRQSYSLSLDYQINPNHTVFLKGIYNRRKDWENRYRSVFKDIEFDDGQWVAELERQTKAGTEDIKYARLEDQQMMNFSLSGKHIFGKLKVDWSTNYAKASEDRPNERYYEIATDGTVPVDVNFSNPEEPLISALGTEFINPSSAWELSEITEEFQFTEDEDVNGRIDFELPLALGKNQSILKFGGRVRTKSKLRNNDFYEYEPVDGTIFDNGLKSLADLSRDNYLAGDYAIGSFISREFTGDLNLGSGQFERAQDLSELAGNFTASEEIFGGYAMVEQRFAEKFLLVAGLRLEQTQLEYEGFQFDDEAETLTSTPQENRGYLNVLPGLHLKYNILPRTVLRFAYTNTLARPNYFDLVPFRQIEDGEELTIGNPDLEATTSTNFDLMAEHYFGTVGILSGGLFYKDVNDFIVTQRFEGFSFEGREWDNFAQPINGGNATLFGVEVAFQRQLDFIAPSLKGMGFYFNYTYTSSEVTDFNFEGREGDELELPGSPEHTLNASIAYEDKRFTSRLSLNYASDFIDEVGESDFFDRHYDQVTYLDLNFSYSLSKTFVLYANANNLLNQPLRYFQSVSRRTMQAEYYNVRFDIGVKFDMSN
ncbi:MAG: TonB-dependent receptor [Saprospiraceae bacterium]|nr:TonB-dependent receptor [Saprospiraceae bacterium]